MITERTAPTTSTPEVIRVVRGDADAEYTIGLMKQSQTVELTQEEADTFHRIRANGTAKLKLEPKALPELHANQ